jgi:flagellar biosynthesis/type III secretory pathway chaperone
MSNPAARLNELVTVVDRLEQVLAKETEMLDSLQTGELTPVIEEKQRLSEAYQRIHEELTDDPSPLSILTEAQKEGLRDLLSRFRNTTRENERALGAAKHVSERVIEAVVDSVKKHNSRNSGYTSQGARGFNGGRDPGIVPVAIDRNI